MKWKNEHWVYLIHIVSQKILKEKNSNVYFHIKLNAFNLLVQDLASNCKSGKKNLNSKIKCSNLKTKHNHDNKTEPKRDSDKLQT